MTFTTMDCVVAGMILGAILPEEVSVAFGQVTDSRNDPVLPLEAELADWLLESK